MQLSIQGRQIDVGDALRQHISESLSGVIAKYFGDAIDASVTLTREGSDFGAKISIHIGKGIQLEASEVAGDIYPAFDLAAEKLAKRLRRYKRRLKDHHQKMQHAETVEAQQFVIKPDELESDEELTSDLGDEPAVIAELTTDIPNLTVSEAVMRLDLIEEGALMFRNRAHGGLNMVYRRGDGNIGWVDPQSNGD